MNGARFRCPGCGKTVHRRVPDFPFCSERCRQHDLANWASESYVIPASLPFAETGDEA